MKVPLVTGVGLWMSKSTNCVSSSKPDSTVFADGYNGMSDKIIVVAIKNRIKPRQQRPERIGKDSLNPTNSETIEETRTRGEIRTMKCFEPELVSLAQQRA